MAVKQWTVTLEEHEREALQQAVDGRPIEYVLRRLRAAMTAGRDTVNDLAKSKESITADQISAARQVLTTRRYLLTKLPDEADPELIESATTPIDAGIAECDRLLHEELGVDNTDDSTPTPETEFVNGGTSYAPTAAAGQHI